MIDAQPINMAARQQLTYQPVCMLEHFRVVHAQRRQIIDIEETAIVDLVRCYTPESQPVGLGFQQFVERIKVPHIGRRAVECRHILLHELRNVGTGCEQCGQVMLVDFPVAGSLRHCFRRYIVAQWQMGKGRNQGLESQEFRVTAPQPRLQAL